jgi:hypothetical protein
LQKKSKYNAVRTEYNGINYASKAEARYALLLDEAIKSGDLNFYLRQVGFDLPGKKRYFVDFVEFWENGDVKFTDVKGCMTKVSKLKIDQVEDLYPVRINIVKK